MCPELPVWKGHLPVSPAWPALWSRCTGERGPGKKRETAVSSRIQIVALKQCRTAEMHGRQHTHPATRGAFGIREPFGFN